MWFFNERLNNSKLEVFGAYPNDIDELIIVKITSITSGSTSFRSLDGTGSTIQVVGLDNLTSLYNSLFPIEENESGSGIVPQGSIAYYLM